MASSSSCHDKKVGLDTGRYLSISINKEYRKVIDCTIDNKAIMRASPIMMIYLRADSTYVLGFCDCQISLAGKYRFPSPDTIILFENYSFVEAKEIPDAKLRIYKRKIIFSTNSSIGNIVSYLELNDTLSKHNGFLRNEEISLDSLIQFNKYWDKKRQLEWLDSIMNSRSK